jgi:hypothetical protein
MPSRIAPDVADRTLTLYGFLPGRSGDEIKVQIGNVTVASTRAPQGGIRVELPATQALTEQTFIPITVAIRRPSGPFGWLSKTTAIQDRVYVQAAKPYVCKVSRLKPNPGYLVEVVADKAFSDEATTQGHAARGSVNRTLSARDVFLATVASAQDTYDLDTVRIKDPRPSFSSYGDCEHYSTRHKITLATPELVSYELYAPEVKAHFHSGMKMRDLGVMKTKVPYAYPVEAGGTKTGVSLKPRFLASKKGAVPLTEEGTEVVAVGWQPFEMDMSVARLEEWAIHVVCEFRDGDEKWSTGPMILRKADPIEIGRGFAARIAETKLYLVPLAGGEQYDK